MNETKTTDLRETIMELEANLARLVEEAEQKTGYKMEVVSYTNWELKKRFSVRVGV